MLSYHNHSTFSDGKYSVADMVQAAQRVGLIEFRLSDHMGVHPQGRTYG